MTPARFPKFAFFRNPSDAPGMGLGDDLMTIRVLEHPWGPTFWPLGLCSPCHGPPKSFKIAVCRWFHGIWCEHKLPKQFSTLYRSKMETFCKITSQRLLDQSQAGVYMGKTPHTPPILAFLGFFTYPTPRD